MPKSDAKRPPLRAPTSDSTNSTTTPLTSFESFRGERRDQNEAEATSPTTERTVREVAGEFSAFNRSGSVANTGESSQPSSTQWVTYGSTLTAEITRICIERGRKELSKKLLDSCAYSFDMSAFGCYEEIAKLAESLVDKRIENEVAVDSMNKSGDYIQKTIRGLDKRYTA